VKTRQIRYELEKWLRALEFIKEENLVLKKRLSEITLLKLDSDLLNSAEDFHSMFLTNDAIVALLKTDILNYVQSLAKEVHDAHVMEKLRKNYQTLSGDMGKLEKNFNKQMFDFNSYASGVFSSLV
jgi:hypothetical protein